jgi:hypothetical protein
MVPAKIRAAPEHERNCNYLFWNIHNMTLQIIPREYNLIFIEEIKIFTFDFLKNLNLSMRPIQSTFGTTIAHDAIKNTERGEDYWQQHSMACQIYEIAVNIRANGMRNRLIKPGERIVENLTGCFERYVVRGSERSCKYLFLNINNMVLQIIPKQHNFDLIFSTLREEFGEQAWRVPIRNHVSFEHLDGEWRNPKSCKSYPDDDG